MARVNRVAPRRRRAKPALGLLHWAERAVVELDKAAHGLEADPVHDLRVAIRRCRSLAEGLRTIDPAPGWKKFRAVGKPLFSSLGELRDTQVMQEWVDKLSTPDDPLRQAITAALQAREQEQKAAARAALHHFDRKRWSKLAGSLDARARRLRPGSRVFLHLALERWNDVQPLHGRALRSRRDADLHQLRIAIKRFRYTVENFLPAQHKRWIADIKRLQDLLGEIHDLDVLRGEIERVTGTAESARAAWRDRVDRERSTRLAEYVAKTTGPDSLWHAWRKELPSGRDLSLAVTAKLRHWSGVLDPDPQRSRRVARLAARLWQALRRELGWPFDRRATVLLRAAALLHGVGDRKPERKRSEYRSRVLGKITVPAGWTEGEMRAVRLAARYSQGVMPQPSDPDYAALSRDEQHTVARLAGILRLANALDSAVAPNFPEFEISCRDGVVTLTTAGGDPYGAAAERLAAARHLLEITEQIAIVVRSARAASRAAAM